MLMGFSGGYSDYGRGGVEAGGGYYPHGETIDGTVVMVYGVDQKSLNCDKLFNLMCLYGNCERVIFFK